MQPCPLCQENESILFHSYENFTLVMCKSCQLIYRLEVDHVQQEQLIKNIYDHTWVAMRDKTKMMVGLQSGWHGHEIYCVAGSRHE